jgi:serine acetyltransferase
VSHDVVLHDFVTLSPGVHIAGNVLLGDGCFVGIGANIIEKLKLGEWSTIGAGSTIIRDVLPNTTVVGVPGRPIKSQQSGWYLRFEG